MGTTSSNPYKDQQNQLSSKDKATKDLKKYAGTVKKFDKNILDNIVKREMRLKGVDPELASEIADEKNDDKRNKGRVESIENYFLNKQKFDLFRNIVSETIKSTIKAQPDIKENHTKLYLLKGVNTGLESTEKNQGSSYWKYMGLQFVKGKLENEIIGRKGTKDITKRIKNSLNSIANGFSKPEENLQESGNDNENYDNEDNDNENNSTNNENSTTDASSTPSKPTNEYLNLDARDLTEAIKNMSKNYNEKLLKAQDEINAACMEQLKSVRENAKRFFNYTLPENKNTENGYLVTLDKIVDNKKKLYPIAPVPSTNEESNKVNESSPLKPTESGAADLPAVFKSGATTPTASVVAATSKPNHKILPPPTTPPQTTSKLPPPQSVNTLPPPLPTSASPAVTNATESSTKLPSYAPANTVPANTNVPISQLPSQPLAPPPAITSPVSNPVEQNSRLGDMMAPPAGPPTSAGASESGATTQSITSQEQLNTTPSAARNNVINNSTLPNAENKLPQQPKGQNAATDQGTSTSAPKQTDNKSTAANNPAPKKSYKPLTERDLITAEDEIIAQYNKQLKDTYDELIKEFQKNQSDAFAALSKISNFDSDEDSINDFEECKDNLSNAEDSMYNFNLSLGNFLNMLAQKMPKAPAEKENKNEGTEQNNKTPQNEQQASQEVKNAEEKLDQKIEEVKKTTSEESAPENDNNDDNVIDVFDMAGEQGTIGTTLQNFFDENKEDENEDEDEDEEDETVPPITKDFQDILTGKMYQSDFLENVVDCLMTLLRYIPENIGTSGGAFNKKGDDTFSKQDIRDLIAAAQPTAESNIYNLRQVAQKEYAEEYAKAHGIDGEDDLNNTLKEFFATKNKKDKDKTKKVLNKLTLGNEFEMFQYTRALIRAYISAKNNFRASPTEGVTTSKLAEKDRSFYDKFIEDVGRQERDFASVKELCRDYLEDCYENLEELGENNGKNYKDLLECIDQVKNGRKWFPTNFTQVLRNINRSGSTSDNSILTEDTWLYQGEGRTELTIQSKKVRENIGDKNSHSVD